MARASKANDDELIAKISQSIDSGKSFDTYLDTDERVLARITDGIYRQPASALRELIANAYDADATVVSVTTDAPRFTSIKVSDDGIGMSPETLANLILHIGGSAKRTQRGPKLGVTSSDPTRTKRGRRVIGKIGIGLFSVAQLTRQFVITTKTAGTGHQLLAHVTLNRPDEAAELSQIDPDGKHTFRAGTVRVWAERTPDKKGHGTSIRLTALLPRVVHLLQSQDIWKALDDDETRPPRLPPLCHIGRIDPKNNENLIDGPIFPWDSRDNGTVRFTRLVTKAYESSNEGALYSRLEHCLDNYFQMIWTLGLSLPLPYVEEHPFGLTHDKIPACYSLPDRRTNQQLPAVVLRGNQTVKKAASLPDPNDSASDFTVDVDNLILRRPIRFTGYSSTAQAYQGPVLFVGKASPDLSAIPEDQRGGRLSFAGYFFWTPRLVPQEHRGLLVRIHGASGTLFDPTFLKYQVGERRLSQIMGEVFVSEGLEGALSIDREAFNTAHPHYQVLAAWVHNALRLIRNTLKGLQSDALQARRQKKEKTTKVALTDLVESIIANSTDLDPSDVPEVVFAADQNELKVGVKQGKIAFLRGDMATALNGAKVEAASWDRAGAVARLLEAHGVLDDLELVQRTKLIAGIVKLFT